MSRPFWVYLGLSFAELGARTPKGHQLILVAFLYDLTLIPPSSLAGEQWLHHLESLEASTMEERGADSRLRRSLGMAQVATSVASQPPI